MQRLDDDGKEVLEEFCSATMAAKKLVSKPRHFRRLLQQEVNHTDLSFATSSTFTAARTRKSCSRSTIRKTIAEFESVGAASLSTGAGKHSIARLCNGILKTRMGGLRFKWKYEHEHLNLRGTDGAAAKQPSSSTTTTTPRRSFRKGPESARWLGESKFTRAR